MGQEGFDASCPVFDVTRLDWEALSRWHCVGGEEGLRQTLSRRGSIMLAASIVAIWWWASKGYELTASDASGRMCCFTLTVTDYDLNNVRLGKVSSISELA